MARLPVWVAKASNWSHPARSCGVELVCEISCNEVADDHVSTHIIRRKTESRPHMRVQGNTSQSVIRQLVADDVARARPAAPAPTGAWLRPVEDLPDRS